MEENYVSFIVCKVELYHTYYLSRISIAGALLGNAEDKSMQFEFV